MIHFYIKKISTKLLFTLGVICFLSITSLSWAESGHSGSHGQHFTKPLVTIFPNVATEFEVKYLFLDEEHAKAHEGEIEFAYAVTKNFGIELKIPYIYHDPDGESHGGGDSHGEDSHHSDDSHGTEHLLRSAGASHGSSSQSDFGNVVFGIKMQNDAFADDHVLIGYGLGLELPTGDSSKGIGSDDLYSLLPFYSIGYMEDSFQIITSGRFGLPLSSEEYDADDATFDFGTSFLYVVSDEFRPFIEIDGDVMLEGDHSGDTVVNLSPGFRYKIVEGVDIGAGVSFPITSREHFDLRAISSLLFEFN